MKKLLLPAVLIALSCLSYRAVAQTAEYDSALAKKLNADDYGMKRYILVILKTGSVAIDNKTERDSIFRGHMSNMDKLAAENKLVVAGPIGKNEKSYRGLFVFNTENMDEARQWLTTDPAVQAKVLDADLFPFYCSAALQEVGPLHNKVQKKSM